MPIQIESITNNLSKKIPLTFLFTLFDLHSDPRQSPNSGNTVFHPSRLPLRTQTLILRIEWGSKYRRPSPSPPFPLPLIRKLPGFPPLHVPYTVYNSWAYGVDEKSTTAPRPGDIWTTCGGPRVAGGSGINLGRDECFLCEEMPPRLT